MTDGEMDLIGELGAEVAYQVAEHPKELRSLRDIDILELYEQTVRALKETKEFIGLRISKVNRASMPMALA